MGSTSWQDRLDRSALLRSSAGLCRERRELCKAQENLEQALAILNEPSVQDPIPVVKVLHELGALAQEQGKLGEAETYYLQALELCEKSLGPMAIATATRVNYLAWLYRQQGEIGKSERLLGRSLSIYLERLGAVNKPVALMLMALAVLNKRNGNESQAENYRQELKSIEEQLQNSSKEVEEALQMSRVDSSRKRKTTRQLSRHGIIPGDSNDFPQLEFVLGSLLGDSSEQHDAAWETSVSCECSNILKQMDEFLDKVRGKKKGPIEKYEENADGSISVQAGNQANCPGIAAMRVRITRLKKEEFVCRTVNNPSMTSDLAFVPGALVPEFLLDELFRGARIAYADLLLNDGGGTLFELIEAVVHPNEDQKAPYRNAGWLAIAGWSKRRGIEMKADSKNRLWQYPLL